MKRGRKRKPTSKRAPVEIRELADIEKYLAPAVARARPPRWNPDPEEVQKSVVKLVLTLVELIRKLLERQAIRRMENDTLTDAELEQVGLALMKLEKTVHQLAGQFGLSPEELNLDLGPIGRLL